MAIVGGTGQAQAAQDAPRLVILIDKTLNNGVDLTQDSELQINDKPAIRLRDYSSKTNDEGKDKFLYKLPVSYLRTGKNTLKIKPKGDEFAIYKIWIENAKGERNAILQQLHRYARRRKGPANHAIRTSNVCREDVLQATRAPRHV